MNNLLDLVVYIFNVYPRVEELSKPRLVKLIYLIDWKYTIDNGKQYTSIKWYYNHYGPYVDDIIYLIKQETDIFNVRSTQNSYGNLSDKVTLIKKCKPEIPSRIQEIADYMVNNTYKLNWSEFISLVYSTYPIKHNPQYNFIDLESDALLFKNSKRKELA